VHENISRVPLEEDFKEELLAYIEQLKPKETDRTFYI